MVTIGDLFKCETFLATYSLQKEYGHWEYLVELREKYGPSTYNFILFAWYYENNQQSKALRILEEDITYLEELRDSKDKNLYKSKKRNEDEDKRTLLYFYFLKYVIYKDLGKFVEARKACMYVLNHAKANDTFWGNGENMLEKAEEDIKELDEKNLELFPEMKPQDRRLLLPVDKRPDLSKSNKVLVFDIDHLPSQIRFTTRYPLANQLYIEHPYNKGLYLPFENYELELLKERVSEYCKVMQALGAIEVTIDAINTKGTSSETEKDTKVSGEANIEVISISGEYGKNTKNKLVEKLKQSINFHQKFTPRGEPRLPENLVWYAGDKSLQDIYEQRFKDNSDMPEWHSTIETEQSQLVNNSELKRISGEVEYLLKSVKVEWEESMKSMFEIHENAYLSINVKFAPLEELQGKNPQFPHQEEAVPISDNSQKEGYSEVEKEYMEYTQELLEEFSEISPRERRILNKRREKLGIPKERAKELESIIQKATLTEEEKEYMEYVQDWLEESPELSHSTRRVLNKRREKLGISEERAAELEEIAKK